MRTTSFEIAIANGPADVFIDSKVDGAVCAATSACARPWLPGKLRVIVERPGFERYTSTLEVTARAVGKLTVRLTELPSLVTVRTTPADARVTIAGAAYAAPAKVPAGDHAVVVTRDGYVTDTRTIAAHEGKPVEVVWQDAGSTPAEAARFGSSSSW